MNAPFDPDETHGGEHDEQLLDANSMTWGSVDPDFDESFRERLGPLPIMPTPPYAFERVLVAGRRRRARKVWSGAAAAAFVVMAGTAGTTVALNGGSSASGPTIGPAGTRTTVSSPAVSPSASPSATTQTPSPATTTAAGSATSAAGAGAPTGSATTSAGTPWCASDNFQLTVSTESTGSATTAELVIVLTNTSGHTCTTYGFPGLELETQSGQLQSTTVTREKTSSARRLTVPAGDSISTTPTYTVSTAAETGAADCGAPSYYLAVIPPNEQTQIVEPIEGAPITVCGSGVLDTGPFVLDSSGN